MENVSINKINVVYSQLFQRMESLNLYIEEPSQIDNSVYKSKNSFVKIHKGYVNVNSEVGVGSTFEVVLPNKINDLDNSISRNFIASDNIMGQSKIERCNIEFSDIYN